MIDFPDAKKVAAMLAAVGEPTRLLILYRLARVAHHVGQLAELLGVPMVNMSHHLGVMRQAGLLEDEKDGRRVVYKFRSEILTPGESSEVLATLTLGLYRLVILKADETAARARRKAGARKPVRKTIPAPKGLGKGNGKPAERLTSRLGE